MSHGDSPLDDFTGTARLFPLPNLVLFPSVIQPLHIFEPRYRALMGDALADDRLMALALLRPGWEEDYHKAPTIYPVVCLGRIFQEERLADGRYNLLLHGLSPARAPPARPAADARPGANPFPGPQVPPRVQLQLTRRPVGRRPPPHLC